MLADEILILGLELPVQIGVPDAERAAWQVLRADVILRPAQAFEAMNDEIGRTVDHGAVANALKALAARASPPLDRNLGRRNGGTGFWPTSARSRSKSSCANVSCRALTRWPSAWNALQNPWKKDLSHDSRVVFSTAKY